MARRSNSHSSGRVGSSPARPGRLSSLPLLFLLVLSGCSLPPFRSSASHPVRVLHIAAIFPLSGVDAPLGKALQRGAALAVRQHVRLARGYRVALTPIDELGISAGRMKAMLAQRHVLSIVGSLESSSPLALLPAIEEQRITTISLAALPGGPPALQTRPEGSPPAKIRPAGGPLVLYHLAERDADTAKTAADLALSPAPGPAARTIFVLDDRSLTGRTLVASFSSELRLKGGMVVGRRSITREIPGNVQAAVSAIIEADPNLVFYAGGTAAGADLRRTLSLTGAPHLPILTAGSIADHPGWSAAVGNPAASASTLGLLPAQDLSALPRAQKFVSSYHRMFPGTVLLPQSALAYDAAMDELTAMKALIQAGKPVIRRSVGSIIASTQYRGITGTLAFDRNGDVVTPLGFSLYVYQRTGGWHYRGAVGAGGRFRFARVADHIGIRLPIQPSPRTGR